jgi:hypothetical protein
MDKVSKGLAQGFSAHSKKVGWGRTGVFFFLMFATAAIPFSPVDAANFSSWQYNRTFTIAAPGTGSAVTNFPVMVRLNGKGSNSGNATDSLIFATALSNGGDIRFSNTGTTDSIPFEIQRYDAKSMVAIFWVLVPSVASGSTNTTFKMYWGNAGLTGTPSNPNAVFARGASGNGFESVYHLREATGTTITDATANGYAMTANGTITQNAGVNPGTDSSEAFDGSTGYYSGTSPNATFRYIFTVSGWFYDSTSGGTSNGGGVFSKGASGWASGKVSFYFGDGGADDGAAGSSPTMVGYSRNYIYTTQSMGTDGWHHVAWVFNYNGGTQVRQIYIDGVSQTTSGSYNSGITIADNASNVSWLGQSNTGSGSAFFSGRMQEFRIDSVARSADWVNLCYLTQKSLSIVSGGSIAGTPLTPVLTSPTNGAAGLPTSGLALSWSSPAGPAVSSYNVSVATVSNFTSTVYSWSGLTTTSQVLPSLPNFTIYYWQVSATNVQGTGSWTSIWSFTTIAPFGAPSLSLPGNGAANQQPTVNFTWQPVSGAVNYELQVSTSSTLSGVSGTAFASTVYDNSAITGISQAASGLQYATGYYWQVRAGNGSIWSAYSSSWSFQTGSLPTAPQLTSPSNGATNQAAVVALSWGTSNAATSYTVRVTTDGSWGTTIFQQTGLAAAGATVSWNSPNLLPSITYYWEANATNGVGSSPWSAAWSFTTAMVAPAAPVLSSPGNGSMNASINNLTLSWGSVAGATSYTLQVTTVGDFSSTTVNQTGLTNAYSVIGGLKTFSFYYWRVAAANPSGMGAWAPGWSFLTASTATLHGAGIKGATCFAVRGSLLAYSIAKPSEVEISFSDMAGRVVGVVRRKQAEGSYTLDPGKCGLSAGRYAIRFRAAGIEKRASVTISR